MKIQGKPNIDAFLDAGNAPQPMPKAAGKVTPAPSPALEDAPKRTKKLFELPETLIADLEQRCVDERRQLGRRVTQTEIVERALGSYLYSKP
jgi:hypothetical protein